jgi:putative ABC transport system permease protein
LMQRLDGLPGVTSMAIASDLPLNNGQPAQVAFEIEGVQTATGARGPKSDVTAISPAYFKTVGIPLLRGRPLTAADRDTSNTPVVISQHLAKTFWGGRDPLTTRIMTDGKHWSPVVGIVGDVRQNRLDGDVTDEIYFPVLSSGNNDMRVFLRASGPIPPLIPELRAAVRDVDPQQPVASIQTLEQVRGAQLAEPRLATTLLIVFAVVTLLLTATGLAGVIGYGVTQRLPEIAIRVALGASPRRVQSLVMAEGLGIVLLGLVVGVATAAATGRVAAKMLFHVTPSDLPTYMAVVVVILSTAAIACFVPSRRALKADPAQVFRSG